MLMSVSRMRPKSRRRAPDGEVRGLRGVSIILDDDLREHAAAIARAARQRRGGATRGLDIALRAGTVGLGDHARTTAVGFLADARIERQLAEQRHAMLRGQPRPATGAEDVLDVPAVAADVHAHVL